MSPSTLLPGDDRRRHSRLCSIRRHDHGPECHSNCPSCGGQPEVLEDERCYCSRFDLPHLHTLREHWVRVGK